MLQLVDRPKEWKAYAMSHYALLIKVSTVKKVGEPHLQELSAAQPWRAAMKFKIAPLSGAFEKICNGKETV